MDTFSINELHGDPMNPRVISKEQYEKLKHLLDKFGDLSGIVRNVRTNQLAGGHMRLKKFEESAGQANVQITQRFDNPTKAGTVAVGYVVVDGEMFSYREVDWDEGFQRAANIAANNAGGENDDERLAQVLYEISQLENGAELLDLTALTEKNIEKLMQSIGVVDTPEQSDDDDPETNELVIALTPEQSEFVTAVLDEIKAAREIPSSNPKTMNGSALYYMAVDYRSAHEKIEEDYLPPEIPRL